MNLDDLFLCPICRHIPAHERKTFLDALSYKTKFYNKGEWIARQGDTVTALYIILKGSVKAEMISESGSVMKIETIHAPNPIASAFLFAENNKFPVDVVALEPCQFMIVSKESIMKQFTLNEAFLRGFMTFNANRTHFLSERIKLLSSKTIKSKLSQYILTRSVNSDFALDMSQTALAEYFGVTRPSLSRCLSEMVHEGVISLKGKRGKILNSEKLKELIAH